MAWGALIGLGSGLQQVGGLLMDNNKQKLAQQLEIDREKRAEARADKIYQRDQSSFDHSTLEQTPEGVWMQVDYAKSGRKMDSRLAPPNLVNDMTNKEQADKVSLENAVLQGKKMQSDLDYAPEKQALDRADTLSNIQYRDRMGLASTMRADNAEKTPASFYDAVDQLVKDTSDLQAQYTKPAPGEDKAPLTATEYRAVVEQSVKAAAQRGLDARAVLRGALERRVKAK